MHRRGEIAQQRGEMSTEKYRQQLCAEDDHRGRRFSAQLGQTWVEFLNQCEKVQKGVTVLTCSWNHMKDGEG